MKLFFSYCLFLLLFMFCYRFTINANGSEICWEDIISTEVIWKTELMLFTKPSEKVRKLRQLQKCGYKNFTCLYYHHNFI